METMEDIRQSPRGEEGGRSTPLTMEKPLRLSTKPQYAGEVSGSKGVCPDPVGSFGSGILVDPVIYTALCSYFFLPPFLFHFSFLFFPLPLVISVFHPCGRHIMTGGAEPGEMIGRRMEDTRVTTEIDRTKSNRQSQEKKIRIERNNRQHGFERT